MSKMITQEDFFSKYVMGSCTRVVNIVSVRDPMMYILMLCIMSKWIFVLIKEVGSVRAIQCRVGVEVVIEKEMVD